EHRRAAAAELDRAAGLLLAQDAVDGRARGAGEAGEVLLGQRHDDVRVTVAVDLGDLNQPPQYALLRRHVQRLDEVTRQAPILTEQDRDNDVRRARVALAQAIEVDSVHAARFGRFERGNGRRAALLARLAEQRELAEHLPWAEHRQDRRV